MPLKQRTNTLTDRGVADLQEIGRRVLRKGPSTACTPYNRGSRPKATLPPGELGQGLFVIDDTRTFKPAYPFFVLHDPNEVDP